MIAGKEHAVDMRAINPYKKVLSHGGKLEDIPGVGEGCDIRGFWIGMC